MRRGESPTGVEVMSAARARKDMKSVFDRAIHGHLPVPLGRDGAELMFGLSSDEMKHVLSIYEFHPEVMFDDDVSVWLPEFEIYGTGESLEEATADLVEEAIEYVADYFGDDASLRSAPNRRNHYPYALRILVASFDDDVEQVLLAQPRETVGAAG